MDKLPGFTAEAALGPPTQTYRGKYQYGSGMPASVGPTQMENMEGEEFGVEGLESMDEGMESETLEGMDEENEIEDIEAEEEDAGVEEETLES